MKKEQLIDIISNINDGHLENALKRQYTQKSGRRAFYTAACAAACIALIVGTVFIGKFIKNTETPPDVTTPPPINTPSEDFVIENGTLLSYVGSDTEVILPQEVTAIAADCFSASENAENITTISLGENVKMIEEAAFSGLPSLDEIVVSDGNENFVFSEGILLAKDGTVIFSISHPTLLQYSTWYYFFTEENDRKLSTLDFHESSNTMEWNIGYFESEYINRFSGKFTIDESGIFHAYLYDELRNTNIQISFTLSLVDKNSDKVKLSFRIIESSLDKYKSFENTPILFVQDSTPTYDPITTQYTVIQNTKTQKIVIDFVADKLTILEDTILYDGAMQPLFTFNVIEKDNKETFIKSLNNQFEEDKVLNGKTSEGYSYSVYYKDVEMHKGASARCYKIIININDDFSLAVDAWHYAFQVGYDYSKYYANSILCVIDSIVVTAK